MRFAGNGLLAHLNRQTEVRDPNRFYSQVLEGKHVLELSCDEFQHQGGEVKLSLSMRLDPKRTTSFTLFTDLYAANMSERVKGKLVTTVIWVDGNTLDAVQHLIPRELDYFS